MSDFELAVIGFLSIIAICQVVRLLFAVKSRIKNRKDNDLC